MPPGWVEKNGHFYQLAKHEWVTNLEALSRKGLDEELLADLSKRGSSAADKIKALSCMTSEELELYSKFWKVERGRQLSYDQKLGELASDIYSMHWVMFYCAMFVLITFATLIVVLTSR